MPKTSSLSNPSPNAEGPAQDFLSASLRRVRDKWKEGDHYTAVDLLLKLIQRFPRYLSAHRLFFEILEEENYQHKDIIRCLDRIKKLDTLTPRERMVYGVHLFHLSQYKKAHPYLLEAITVPMDLLKQWGYEPWKIMAMARECKAHMAPSPQAKRLAAQGKKGTLAPAPKERKTRKKPLSSQQEEATTKKGRARPAAATGQSTKAEEATKPESRSSKSFTVVQPVSPPLRMSAVVGRGVSILGRFLSGNIAGIRSYLLAQEASALSQAEHFDHLICLNTLRNVEHYAYQVETVRKVLRSFRGRVLLADEVGLGKTIEAGMVLKEYILRGMVKKTLILTPPALASQWCEELSTKFNLNPTATDPVDIRQDPEHFWQSHDLIVASLALARNRTHRPLLARMKFDMVIVDEAHHVKNDKTAGWELVNELKSRFLLLLSATPVENNLMDLFSLVTLLKPGQLGTRASFRREFVLRGDPTQPRNRERLRELIGEVMIRNTRALADIRLPPRHAATVLVEGEPAERELYAKLTDLVREGYQRNMSRLALGLLLQEAGSSPRAVRKTLLKMAGHGAVDGDMKAQMKKLAKLCEYVPNTSKTARLLELLEVSKEKVLVFSRFTATLEELARRLSESGIRFTVFQGNMSAEEKDRAVQEFQDGTPVMLCSEIGGEGRNLQFCSTMVNYDLPWNPMKIEQRIGRIHRIGQTRPVHVYNLCAINTAEHHILDVLDRRINMFELVIGEVDLVLGQTRSEAEFEDRILNIYATSQSEEDVRQAFEDLGDELLAARQQYDKIKRLDSELFANDYEI